MQPSDLTPEFVKAFGTPPEAWSLAPGRVNLIGEHVDYNDGLVLPMAIGREVQAVGRITDHAGKVQLHSINFDQTEEVTLEGASRTGTWTDYPVGMLLALQEKGLSLQGMQIAFYGNVPLGAGLSSSAALEVATGALVCTMTGQELPMQEIALLAQKAENEFVGTNCGVMDQLASALCQRDNLLLLDCRSLETRNISFARDDVRVVIFDTKVERRLADSAYNARREQCGQALAVLQKQFPAVASLRDVSLAQLQQTKTEMDPIAYSRAQHVVEEISRVEKTVDLLERGRVEKVGAVLNESHESLRDLYEVSCEELEIARNEALEIDGVLGGRLTGAGFGGCLVFLVWESAVDQLSRQVHEIYREKTGLTPEIYITRPRGGARANLLK